MRILHVVTLVSPDGAYGGPLRVALTQAAALTARGHEVTLAAAHRGYDTEPPSQMDGVPTRLFRARQVVPHAGFAGLTSFGLWRWVRRHRDAFDVVHIHAARDLVGLPTALLVGGRVPLVLQPHGMIDESDKKIARLADPLLTRPALHRAARVFFLTDRERDSLRHLGVDETKLERLRNGVTAPLGAHEVGTRPEALFMARLHPRKQPLHFVHAATSLASRHSSWTFTLAGPDEGELDSVTAAVESAGVGAQLRVENAVPPEQARKRMAAASLFVLPSVDEPFPMTVLEALAAGVPVIVTDSCGLAHDILRLGAGLVTDGTRDDLVRAMSRLLGDPALLAQMAAAAQSAAREFAIDPVVDQLEATYRHVSGTTPTEVPS